MTSPLTDVSIGALLLGLTNDSNERRPSGDATAAFDINNVGKAAPAAARGCVQASIGAHTRAVL
jgi:hypothetical protein